MSAITLHPDPVHGWQWPVTFGARPDGPEDPALIVECPEGTTVRPWVQ